MRRLLSIIAVCLLSGSALAQNAYVRPALPVWVNAVNAAMTSTSSASFVMAGLGAAASPTLITPSATGRVSFILTGMFQQQTALATCEFKIAYGTGGAPANGAAATGTVIGATVSVRGPATAGYGPISLAANVSGLTVGTQYWFDVQFLTSNVADACILGASNVQLNEG